MSGFIWGFTGPEGSGKSCCMTYYGLLHCTKIAKYYGYKTAEAYAYDDNNPKSVKCFSGYELHGCANTPLEDTKLSSEINQKKWLRNFGSDEYRNMMVCIDEVQNYLDSAVSNAVFARILSHAMAQRRRVGLGLMYTVQNWDWVQNRIRFTTHMVSSCFDLYWTKWGKAEGLGRGEMLSINTYDAKGFYTGKPWELFSKRILVAKNIWPFYDSFEPADFMEAEETKYAIKKTIRTINEDDDYDDYNTEFPSGRLYIPSDDEKRAMERMQMDREMTDGPDAEYQDKKIRKIQKMSDKMLDAGMSAGDVVAFQQMVNKL